MISCSECKQVITGKNVVVVVDTMVFHELCIKAREAKTSGFPHKCPKCNGAGTFTNTQNDCEGECGFTGCIHKDYKVITDCTLCDAVGFLAEEPIPVIVDWKKRT